MWNRLGFRGVGRAVVERGHALILAVLTCLILGRFKIGGIFNVECFDIAGNLRWSAPAKNMVTTVGITHLLNVYFNATTAVTTWYIGIIDNAGFTTLAAADTMSSHSGWSEVGSANYSNANRVTWGSGAPSSGAVTNASSANFNMTPSSTLTVNGLFLVSDNTKGGTAGILFATASFTGGTQAVNNGDTLKVTYTVSATSS